MENLKYNDLTEYKTKYCINCYETYVWDNCLSLDCDLTINMSKINFKIN